MTNKSYPFRAVCVSASERVRLLWQAGQSVGPSVRELEVSNDRGFRKPVPHARFFFSPYASLAQSHD